MSSQPLTLRHSGKLGDVLYALACLDPAEPASLFLRVGEELSREGFETLLPLLRLQPCLAVVEEWDGQQFDVDLDPFRQEWVRFTNLADAHANVLRRHGVPVAPDRREAPWLRVDQALDLGQRDVVFARSPRYHGAEGFWPEAMRLLGDRAVFVGTEEEHAAFASDFGEVPFRPTSDLLELGRLIAGCALFVGNQSCPLAIAEGLKVPVIQETDRVAPNCFFNRDGLLSVSLDREIQLMEPFVRTLEERRWRPKAPLRFADLLPAEPSLPVLPSCLVLHDDFHYLRDVVRLYRQVGPVTAFVSVRAWNGDDGRWDKCASEAAAMGAEVVPGDWPDETLQRRVALEEMRRRGHRHVLLPDGDEFVTAELMTALRKLAAVDAADVVRVSMETYWKGPEYRIHPPERLRPVMMVDAQTCHHSHVREYEGPRLLVLGPDHGVMHHLSYGGPDERIRRKLATWGHRTEVVPSWYERVWKGWDRDRTMRDLHPTHPTFYGFAERIPEPREKEAREFDPNASTSVVIPLYGGEQDIHACLSGLSDCLDLLSEVVVVDDASPDAAAEVAAAFPFVTLFRNERNLGFAASCNRGYAASTGETVVFLNSDAVVPRAGMERLLEALRASGTVGAVGPRTNHCAGPQQLEPTYTRIENLGAFAEDFAQREADDEDVPFLVGFCLACRRSALEEVAEEAGKAFDERFGTGMFEDNDLSYRLLRAGYRLRIAQRAYVHHGGSHSLSRAPVDSGELFRHNQILFERKWRDELASGYASHLPGHSGEPIRFDPERAPEKRKKRLERLAREADVSLCMIVRDEERVLGACLDSVAGAFSQVVVIDTGSKDRTKEIAREHGAELHEIVWPESFAAARNESLKYARGRWVFWLDADDTVPPASLEAILQAAVSAPEDVVGFVVPVQFVEEGPSAGTRVDHVKLFRNLSGIRFEGRIHEQVLASLRAAMPQGRIERIPGAVVLHSGYDTSPEGQARKAVRDERLLALDLEERPGHPFVLFNLGMTAHYRSGHPEAVEWLRRSVEAAQPGESHVRKAYALMAVSLRESEGPEAALACVDEGLAAVGQDPELLFHKGLLLARLGRLEEAREAYLAMPLDVGGWFTSLDVGILSFKRSHNLGEVCLGLGRYLEARDWFLGALSENPAFAPSAEALGLAALEQGDLQTARMAVEALLRAEGPSEAWARLGASLAERAGEDPLAFLAQAAERHPEAIGPGILLARRLLEEGREDAAEPLLLRLDRLGSAEAAFFRGVIRTRRGELLRSLAHMRRADALAPGHAQTEGQVRALEEALSALPPPPRADLSEEERAELLTGPHVGELGAGTLRHSVVVVAYNSERTLEACLSAALRDLPEDGELIVVDNASQDGTAGILAKFAEAEARVRPIFGEENLGYARGANLGILASRGAYVTLLNPDAEPFPGLFEALTRRIDQGYAAVGPVSDRIGGDQYVAHYLEDDDRPPVSMLADRLSQTRPGLTVPTRMLMGVCLMLSRETLDRHGLLDEACALGADDLELSWRLRALGHRIAVSADAFVRHDAGVSFASLPEGEKAARVGKSDLALLTKLRAYYGAALPTSEEIWGSDVFQPVMNASEAALS
jgi:GT2 family glycosyltransferase